MSRPILLLGLLLFGASLASALTVARTFLKPNGKPAAKATVILRALKPDGSLKEERRLTTDDKGAVTTDIEVDPAAKHPGYLLVYAPGCALTLCGLTPPSGAGNTLRLLHTYTLSGMVKTPKGAPVAGAKVNLVALGANDPWSFGKYWMNASALRLTTPELTAVSNAKGAFTLKGVVIARPYGGHGHDGGEPIPISVAAQVAGPAGLLAGEAHLSYHPGPLQPGDKVEEYVVTLAPTLALQGRVVEAVSGLAVEGAVVQLAAPLDAVAALPPITTKADGAYAFSDVIADTRLFVVASHPQLASGWLRATEAGDTPDAIRLTPNTTLSLRPLTRVTGRLLDPITHQPPPAPLIVFATYDEGFSDGQVQVGRASMAVKMETDGSFALTTAIGGNTLTVIGPGYRAAARVLAVGVPATGLEGVDIPLARERGILCHFNAADLAGLVVQARKPGSDAPHATPPIKADGWGFYSVPTDWAGIELRVLRNGAEVVPWTVFMLGAGQWPVEVKVP